MSKTRSRLKTLDYSRYLLDSRYTTTTSGPPPRNTFIILQIFKIIIFSHNMNIFGHKWFISTLIKLTTDRFHNITG